MAYRISGHSHWQKNVEIGNDGPHSSVLKHREVDDKHACCRVMLLPSLTLYFLEVVTWSGPDVGPCRIRTMARPQPVMLTTARGTVNCFEPFKEATPAVHLP